jgi:hypothetical protein
MSALMDFMFERVTDGTVIFAASGYSNLHVPEDGVDAPSDALIAEP